MSKQSIESKANSLFAEISDFLDNMDMDTHDIKNKIIQYGNYCTAIGMYEEREQSGLE